jgi:hypothetical protein
VNLAAWKSAVSILSTPATVSVLHAAWICGRRFRLLVMEGVGEPTHDFFCKQADLFRPVVNEDVIPHSDPSLVDRELYSEPPAAMLDINDGFCRHDAYPVASTPLRPGELIELPLVFRLVAGGRNGGPCRGSFALDPF